MIGTMISGPVRRATFGERMAMWMSILGCFRIESRARIQSIPPATLALMIQRYCSPYHHISSVLIADMFYQVSPYNLWSVRIVRYLSILFALLTFFWWTILLVSTFVTPPGFHTRGSGFFPFSYSSLALANLLFTLVFFAIPSKAVRVLSIVMGGILLLDVILVLAVEKTRHEEGWVGMVSVLCKSEVHRISTL